MVGENIKWLVENDVCIIILWNGLFIIVMLLNFVEFEIIEIDFGFKGDIVGIGGKLVMFSMGVVVCVFLFV